MAINTTPMFFDTNIRYGSAPTERVGSTEIALSLWKNDRGYINCILPSASSDTSYRFRFDALPKGVTATFFAIRETLCFVGHAGWYAFNRKGILPTGPKKPSGDILEEFSGEITVQAGKQQPVWIRFDIDKTAAAGNSDVILSIRSNNKDEKLKIDLTVTNLSLPDAANYSFRPEYWQHPYNSADYYGVEPFSEEHLKILTEIQKTYRDLGGYGVVASVVEEAWGGQTYLSGSVKYPSMVRWTKKSDGSFAFDYRTFDRWVELNESLGIAEKIICYSLMPWGSIITYYDEKKLKTVKKAVRPAFMRSYKKVWLQFLNDFVAHLDAKGWFDKVYLGFDERSNMSKVLDVVQSVKNREGKNFKVSASFNSFLNNRACFDRLDYASVGLDEVRAHPSDFKAAADERRRSGKRTSVYTATEHYPNSFGLSQPSESYWSILYAYSAGADCFLRWAFDAWVKDPLTDATHCSFPAADCFLVYPGARDAGNKKPQLSARLVKLDEGVRDVNKLMTMSQNPELKSEIEKLLSSVKPNYSSYTLKDSSWGVNIRTATWADDAAVAALSSDMNIMKEKIAQLSSVFQG